MSKQITKNNTIFNIDDRYKTLLTEIKDKIRSGRLQAALAVNKEVISLYWYIGKRIIEKQAETKWGDKLIITLSNDLQHAFPETHGFSTRNLKYMRQFASFYKKLEFGQQAVAQLPWGHIILLLQRVKDTIMQEWYAQQTIENGWSRYTLEDYIKQNLYERQAIEANKVTNFLQRLPSPQSRLAQDLIKNPYSFDFLGLHDEAYEREIEYASIQHIVEFMLALGKSFAFVGHQVPIIINDNEFFIDMLFYNLKLRCYTVLEIKSTKFKPEHAGQLNFYLNAVDDLMRHSDDNPSIGLLLCKSRDKVVAEYALHRVESPIGISEYQLTKAIPEKLKGSLPTIEEIEAELNEPSKNLKSSKK